MRYVELFDDAAADLSMAEKAEQMSRQFAEWLTDKTENSVLDKVGEVYTRPLRPGARLVCVAAADVGIEDAPDLYIGFVHGESVKPGGGMLRGMDGGKRIYFVTVNVNFDPMFKQDLAFAIRWGDLIHELVHYLDYRRGVEKGGPSKRRENRLKKRRSDDPQAYYNDSLETNAFFQQGLSSMLGMRDGKLTLRKNFVTMPFDEFYKKALTYFNASWVNNLNRENKKRLAKRLSALHRSSQV